jgi:hypothetical protein
MVLCGVTFAARPARRIRTRDRIVPTPKGEPLSSPGKAGRVAGRWLAISKANWIHPRQAESKNRHETSAFRPTGAPGGDSAPGGVFLFRPCPGAGSPGWGYNGHVHAFPGAFRYRAGLVSTPRRPPTGRSGTQLSRTKSILTRFLEHLQGVLRNLRAARAGHKSWGRGASRTEKSGFRSARPGAAAFGTRARRPRDRAKGPDTPDSRGPREPRPGPTALSASRQGLGFSPGTVRLWLAGRRVRTSPPEMAGLDLLARPRGSRAEDRSRLAYRTSSGNRPRRGGDLHAGRRPIRPIRSLPGPRAGPRPEPDLGRTGQAGQPGSQGRTASGQSRPARGLRPDLPPGPPDAGSTAPTPTTPAARPSAPTPAATATAANVGTRPPDRARVSGMNLKCAYDILCLDYPCTPGRSRTPTGAWPACSIRTSAATKR